MIARHSLQGFIAARILQVDCLLACAGAICHTSPWLRRSGGQGGSGRTWFELGADARQRSWRPAVSKAVA